MSALLLVVSAFLALPCHAAERQFWGPTVDGLRLSVTLGISTERRPIQPEQALQITIGNVGPVERRILLGGITGDGPLYATLHFAVISPEGKRYKMDYTGGGVVGGYVSPLIANIAPGNDYKIQLSLTKFWIMGGPKETLKPLIDAGWAVEASIEVTPEQAGSPSRWTGKLVSGKMRY